MVGWKDKRLTCTIQLKVISLNSLHSGEAELCTTCDTNMTDYENQTEKKLKKSFLSKKLQKMAKMLPAPQKTL